MRIHSNYVIRMALHEELLTGVDVLADEDASSGVVHLLLLENEVGVVQRTEGECSVELEVRFGGKHAHYLVGLVYRRNILTSSLF